MSIDIPPSLQWISYLAGSKWPQGDEDGLWRIGEHWKASASEMSDLIPDLNRVRNLTMSVITGETAATAEEEFAKLFDGEYSVEKLVEAMEALGETARAAGTQIEASKIEILVGLAMAAAEILYAIAMAPWTFGGSLAWIPVIEVFTLAAIRMLFSQLMRALARRVIEALTKTAVSRLLGQAAVQSAQEIAEELIINLSIQKYQIDQGHKDKIDGDDVADAAKGAAAGGAAAGAFHGPAFGALGGKHGGSGIGNAAAGAGASYGAEVVAGVVGAVAVGGSLDAGEIFAGGALGAVSGGIESSHGGKNNPADDAPIDPDAGKSHAFDSDGKGPEGKGPEGKGPEGKGPDDKRPAETDSFDVPTPYAKDDLSGPPQGYGQLNTNDPTDSPPATADDSTRTSPPTDTPQTRDSSSTTQGGGEGQQRPGSQPSPDGHSGAQNNPQTVTGSGQADQTASQPESGGSQTEQSGSSSNSSSERTDERGVQSSPQDKSAGHTGNHTVSPQTAAGQNGMNADGSNPGDTAVHHRGDTADSTPIQHDSQPSHTSSSDPAQAPSATPSAPLSTDATATSPDSQSPAATAPEQPNTDRGSSTEAGSSSSPTPLADAPSPQSDSHQAASPLDDAAPHAQSTSTDPEDNSSHATPPSAEPVVGTPPPTATAATPSATTPSVAATPTPASPSSATPPSPASSAPTPSSNPSATASQSGTANPAATANQSGTANSGSPAKASLGGPGTSVNSAPMAVSSVATSAASPAASRSTADDQPQVVVGMVGGPIPPQAVASSKPDPRRTSAPAQRDPIVDVADDETWRHNPAATADWFDPVEPTPREQIDAHREDAFVQTMDTEVANVLTDSTPTRMPTPHTTLIRYDLRRIELAPNKFVQEYTVKLSLSPEPDSQVGEDVLADLRSKAEAGVDRLLNRGHRLPSGDEFRVRVEFTDTGAHAAVRVGDFDETTQTSWRPDAGENVLAHEILHYLGVPDEGRDPRIALRQRVRNTGVHDGDGGMMASDLLGTDPRLRPRHLWMVERTANSQLLVPPRWLTSADNARIPLVPRQFDPDDQPNETSRAPKAEDTDDTADTSGEHHVRDADGNLHWGRYGAAGLLLRAWGHDGAPRVLLQKRAQWSDLGGTWGLPGGARNRDETADQAALRETQEEAGIAGDRILVRSQTVTATAPGIDWTYSTVVADAPYPLRATSNGEGTLRWVRLDEVGDLELHPGLAASWSDVLAQMDANPMPPPRPSPQIDHTVDPTDVSGVYEIGNPEGAIYFRDDEGLLYREDSRPPEVIFEQGFAIREDYRNNSKVTHFISATRDPHLGYLRTKTPEGPVYRYTIDAPGGVDVNRTVGIRSSDYQTEISFPGGIRRENIVSAVEVFAPDRPDSEGEGPSRLRYGPVVMNTEHFNPDLPNDGAPPLSMGPVGGRDDLTDVESDSPESDLESMRFRRDDDVIEGDMDERDPWDRHLADMGLDSPSDEALPLDHGVRDGRLYVPFPKTSKTVEAAHTQGIDSFADHVVTEARRRHEAGQPGVTVHVQGGGNDGWMSAGAVVVGQQRAQAVLVELRPRIEERLQRSGLPNDAVAYTNPTSRGKTVPEHIPGTDKHARRRMVVAHVEEQPARVPADARELPSEGRGGELHLPTTEFESDSEFSDDERASQGELVPVADQPAAYLTVAPRLSEIVVRNPLPATGLSLDDRFLGIFPRTEEGGLSDRAIEHYQLNGTSRFHGRMSNVELRAGVFLKDIDDKTLARLIDANPHHLSAFPELQTHLARARDSADADDQSLVEQTRQGTTVVFHFSPGDPTAAPRRDVVMSALDLVQLGGYELPNTQLEVHLPRYHRVVRVRAVTDNAGRPVDLDITERPILSRDAGVIAEFVAPDTLIVTSLTVAAASEGVVRSSVADELRHRGLGIVLHEMMHHLHWQQNPALFADLYQTSVRDVHGATVGAVSPYAGLNPSEFVAEAGVGRLLGRSSGDAELDDEIDALYDAFGGPLPERPVGPVAPPELSGDELSELSNAVHQLTGRTLSAGEVLDAQAQLAPFDQWRTLTEQAQLIAHRLGIRPDVHPLEQPPLVTASTSQDPAETPPPAPTEPTDRVFDDDEVAVLRGWQDWAADNAAEARSSTSVEQQNVPSSPSSRYSMESRYVPDTPPRQGWLDSRSDRNSWSGSDFSSHRDSRDLPEPESKPKPESKPEPPPSPSPSPTPRSAPGDEFDVAAYVRQELARYDRARAGRDVEQGGRATAKDKGRWRAAMEATSVYRDVAPHDDAELLDFLGELTFPGTSRPVLEFLSDRLSELGAQMSPRDAEASSSDLDSAEGDAHRPVYDLMRTSAAPALQGAARSAEVLARRPVNIWPPSLEKAGVTLGMTALTAAPWVYASVREERAYIASLVAGFSKVIPRDIGMLLYPYANARLLLNYARDSTFPWQSEVPWALTLLNKKVEESPVFGWSMFGLAIAWYFGLGYGPGAWKRLDSLPWSSGRAVRTGATALPSRDEAGDGAAMVREDLVEPARHIDRAVAVLREAVQQFQAEERGQAISENLRTQIQFVEDDVRWARQWVDGLQGIAPASQPNPDLIGKLAFLVPHLLVHGIATSAGALSDPLSFASSAADGAYVLSRAFAVAFDPNRSVDDAREVFTNLTAEGLPGFPVDLAVIVTTALGREDAVWGNPRVYPGLLAFYGLASMTYAAWLGEMIAYGVAWPITKLFGTGGHAADSAGGAVEAVESPIEMRQLAAPNNLVWDESVWDTVRNDPEFETRLQSVHRWLSPGGGELTEENHRLDANRDKPAALAALHTLHIWHVSGEAEAEKFATSDEAGRQLDDAVKERRIALSPEKKADRKAAVAAKGRIPIPGDGWCLLSAVVLSTPPEQWPTTWVPESSTAAQSYSAALNQARGTHAAPGGQGHLEHARTALYAQVQQFVLARGGHWLPDRAVTLFRGNHTERTQLESWLAGADEQELRERLSELGFDENELAESEEWLAVDTVRERYVAARIEQLTPDAGLAEARRIAHREVGIEAGVHVNPDPPVGRRAQYEYLRDNGPLPTIRDLRAGEELREAVRFASTQRLTDVEYARLLEAVESWQEWGWTSSYGDMFSTLVAHTLDVRVHDVVNHSTVGPENATRTVNVRYNGHNHYEGDLPPLARHHADGRIDGPMQEHIGRAVDAALPANDIEAVTRPESSANEGTGARGGSTLARWSAAGVRQTTIYRDVAHRDDAAFVRLVREELTDPETGELALASLMDDLDDLHALVAAHPRHALSDSQQTAYRVLRSSASAILDRAMGSVQGLLHTESTLHRLRQSIPPVLATPLPYFAPILQDPQSLNFLNLIAGTHLKAALTIGGMASHATYSKRLMGKATFDLLLPLNVPGLVNLIPVMRPSLLQRELTPGQWGFISGGVQAGIFLAAGFADYIPRLTNSALSLAIGAGVPLPETDYHALLRGRLRLLSESDVPQATDAGALESQPAPLTQEALSGRISRIRSRFAMLVAAQHAFEERGAHVSETTEHQISLIGKDIQQLERLAARLVDAPEVPTLGNVDFWPKLGYAGVTAVLRGGGMAASILSRDPLAMATVVPASGFLIARTITELLDPTATASDAAASFMHYTPPALVAILPNVVNYFNDGRTFRTIDNSFPWLLYTLAATALVGDPLADFVARAVSGRLWTSRATPTPDLPAVEHGEDDDGDSPDDMGAAGVPGGFSPDAHHRPLSPSSTDHALESAPRQEEPKGPPAGDSSPSDVDEPEEGWGAAGVPGGFSFGSPDPYPVPPRTSLRPAESSALTERPPLPEDRAATGIDASQNADPSYERATAKSPRQRSFREDSPASSDRWSSDRPLPSFAGPSRLGWTPWSIPNPITRRVDNLDDYDGPPHLPKWTDFAPTEDDPAGPISAPRLRVDIPSDSESFESSVSKAESADFADGHATGGDDFGGPQTGLESVPTQQMHTAGHPDTAHSLMTPEAALALAQQALQARAEPADAAMAQPNRNDDANLIRNSLGDAERSVATARRNAQWWRGLSEDQRRAMVTVYPEQVGNAEGLPAQVRDEANRRVLADTLAREGSDPLRLPKWIDRLNAVRKALRHADNRLSADRGGRPLVLAFDPEAFERDGRILVAVGGDPYRAPSVSWIVPGITTTMGSLGSVLSDAINLMGSARAEGAPDPVVIAWIGYQPPSGWRLGRTTGRNAAAAGGEIVHADIRAFNAGRDANTTEGSSFSNNHVFAHSYGSTTTSFAGRGGRLAGQVRTVTLLGSPGAGPLQSAADFGIGDNVFVASSSRDPVTGFGRMPDPLVPFGQGTDPALRDFGARRLASEFPRAMDELSTVFTHVSYYRHVDAMGSRTQSLTNFGRIVAGRQDQVELHSHRRGGGPLLRVIPRTYEPAIDPSADRRWWGVNWTGPKTAGDEDSIAAETDSPERQRDPNTPSGVVFRETAKTLDEHAREAVQARATEIAREVAERYETDRGARRLVVHVDVGANGHRFPLAGWPFNGRPTAVGSQRAAEIRRLLEEEVHAQLDRLEVPRSRVTFREESRARGLPDSSGRPHDFRSDETARRVVQIRTEAEAPASGREVHIDFAERSTHLGIVQRDELVPFLNHIADEAARRSVAGVGALVVQIDGGGNGGNLLHSADTVGVERARAVREFLQAELRARLGGRGIHTSMVRFAETTSRGNALPGGAPATGNRPTDAQATRRVTVRLEEVPATHHDVDSPPSPRPDDLPPTLPPLPTFGDNDSVHEESRGHETRASSSRGRSSLGRSPVDSGFFLAVSTSRGPDESWLDLESNSDPE